MGKDSELTPEEERILREIQLEKLYSQMVARRDHLELKQALEMREGQKLEEQVRDFVDRFKYSYADKVINHYKDFEAEGINVFLYSEPSMFLICHTQRKSSGDRFKLDSVEFSIKPFVYSHYSCINDLVEELYDSGFSKAAVFEELHMFDIYELPVGPDDISYTPVEAAAWLEQGYFFRMVLEEFKIGELQGRLLGMIDKAYFNKRLYTDH